MTTRNRPLANQLSNNQQTTVTTTQYDVLGRPVSVSYNDGVTPGKAFLYDQTNAWGDPNNVNLGASRGRLTRQLNTATGAGQVFGYDPMGRVQYTGECYPGGCGNGAFDIQQYYKYDTAGNMTQSSFLTNGSSGPRIDTNMQYTVAGEVSSISNTATGPANDAGNVLSNVAQTAFGVQSYTFGDGVTSWRDYDASGRNSSKSLCIGTASSGCSQNSAQMISQQTSVFKGSRVLSREDSFMGGHADFEYDEFNRLISASYPGMQTGIAYGYDRYGNRLSQTMTQGSGPQPQFSVDQGSNRINGFNYDSAGNLLSDGLHSYQYDAEGNVVTVDGGQTATYSYDALNHRIRVDTGGSATAYAFNLDGQRSSSWNAASSGTAQVLSASTFWNGQRLAYWLNSGGPTIGNYATGWIYCAPENGNCSIPHGANSAFGANGNYTLLDQPSGGNIPCTVANFGSDPAPGVAKSCYYSPLPSEVGGTMHYEEQDAVGSERYRMPWSLAGEGAYSTFPFGDAGSHSGSDDDPSHFSELDHDYSSGTDHAQYRQYSSAQGR